MPRFNNNSQSIQNINLKYCNAEELQEFWFFKNIRIIDKFELIVV